MSTYLFNVSDYFSLIPTQSMVKRGNPNWIRKYSDKTKVMRVPEYLIDRVKQFILDEDNQQSLPIIKEDPAPIIQNTVTQINQDDYKIEILDPASIAVDPRRFQFKQMHNAKTGSSGSLKGIKKWDPIFAGLIQIWLDPVDGLTYVVNGHNRLNLAKELGIKSICCQYLNCDTHEQARIKGALHNMIDGKGTIYDCSKVLRETNLTKSDLKVMGIPLKESLIDQALNIANLEDWLFDKTMLGNLEVKQAVAIGQLDKNNQKTMFTMINSYKNSLTDKALLEIKNQIELSNNNQSSSLNLFGDQTEVVNLAVHRSKVTNYVESELRRSAKIFGLVSNNKNHDLLEEVTDNIDSITSCLKKDQAKLVLDVFELEKMLSGQISDKINETVNREIAGENVNKVRNELINWLILFIGNKHNFLNQLMA